MRSPRIRLFAIALGAAAYLVLQAIAIVSVAHLWNAV